MVPNCKTTIRKSLGAAVKVFLTFVVKDVKYALNLTVVLAWQETVMCYDLLHLADNGKIKSQQ